MPANERSLSPIKVIDLFAGPGGLGEGFSSVVDAAGKPVFRIALSVEMDPHAHATLKLRAFYRQFDDESRPNEYYQYIANPTPTTRSALFDKYPRQSEAAEREAWKHELAFDTASEVKVKAQSALKDARTWVLIGGPPCQAYSLVGRARRANDTTFGSDNKHRLYQHYLKLIEDLTPPVFVMENVKGMLSAKLGAESTIEKVLNDLRTVAPGYDIHSFVTESESPDDLHPRDFVIRCEDYGVPQARHRVILLGVRKQAAGHKKWNWSGEILAPRARLDAHYVLADLPALRSRLSRRLGSVPDSPEAWLQVLQEALSDLAGTDSECRKIARSAVAHAKNSTPSAHSTPMFGDSTDLAPALAKWYQRDTRCPRPLNHGSRSHMRSDLGRYLFSAAFAAAHGRAPKLSEFPKALLPAHANVDRAISDNHFADRFRVQRAGAPASTVTSHISKDGHYYIHYDPAQCRSLSVREAARLQTFPDDYFFEGNRTQQYHQVGNAVPPLLAAQLGEIVAGIFGRRVDPVMERIAPLR